MGLGETEESADATIEDVRERDRDRLRDQIEGDLRSGSDRLHTAPPQLLQSFGVFGAHQFLLQ